MGRPKEHGEETRASLLAAAERIAETEGVGAVSVRRVADETATTTRAIYSVFGSKEGLLVALGAYGFEILRHNVDAIPTTDDPVRDLGVAGLAFRKFAVEHPALFRLAVLRELPDPALAREFAATATEAFDRLVWRVQRVADAGRLDDIDVHVAAVEYHCLCEGLAAVELRRVLIRPQQADEMWRDALARFATGLTRAAQTSRQKPATTPRGVSASKTARRGTTARR